MLSNLVLKTGLAVLAAVAVVSGGWHLVKTYNARSLSAVVAAHLDSGEYLAALAAAGTLKEDGKATAELDEQIAEAARLLVAEDALKKAKAALAEKRFADASALLRGSDAVTDPSFKYYEEAKKLHEEAEALAAGVAHKAAVTIFALESRAQEEKKRREETEAARQTLAGTLSQSQAETVAARRQAEASQRDAEVKQTALAAEQARAKALMEQVEKESKQKFVNELKVYRDMAQKGKEQLDNVLAEINGKRDVTALIYVSQGKILFEEAKTKASELRTNRTPAAYQARVDDLLKSLDQFLEASKQFRNAVVYIDDQGSAEFTGGLSRGKAALANAVSLLSRLSDFIAAN